MSKELTVKIKVKIDLKGRDKLQPIRMQHFRGGAQWAAGQLIENQRQPSCN